MSTYTRWYREGSVAVTKNKTEVVGTGTYWLSAGLHAGDMLTLDEGRSFMEISSVTDDTHLTLKTKYTDSTGSDYSYAIVRNFTSTMPASIAAQTAELLGDFQKYIDTDMQQITGKSAYQIAQANGYSGTESQWLESLKAAGEWSVASARLDALEARGDPEILMYHSAGAHNALYRGKNLGSEFTAEQSAAIRAGTFEDLYPGDYWKKTTEYTYYRATSDKTAQEGKTYYADLKGTALESQPSTGSDISMSGYFETNTTEVTVNWRIAGIDYAYGSGDTSSQVSQHHLLIVPDKTLYATQAMNDTDTTEGGYEASRMHIRNLERGRQLIKAAFGAEHILEHKEQLSNVVTDGVPSGGAYANVVLELLTENMLYGSHIRGYENNARFGLNRGQLPLFHYRPGLIATGVKYWTRDIISAEAFVALSVAGVSVKDNASQKNGVRPYFLLY